MNTDNIKLLVTDVDGTLTNGQIVYNNKGEESKSFNVKDGLGLKELAPKHHIICAVITGRKSLIVELRCKELNILHLYQNITDKAHCLIRLTEELNISLNDVAYIGDDINDLDAMSLCGFKACPYDAVDVIKNISDYISPIKGGYGAVRDCIDFIITH